MATQPQHFTRTPGAAPDTRQAEASEHIATRIDTIEATLVSMAATLTQIALELKALASKT